MQYPLFSTAALLLVAMAIVAVASRRKKTNRHNLALISSSAFVDKPLNPEGTVLVGGELWGACSCDGNFIPSGTRVTVVDLRNHLLLVKSS